MKPKEATTLPASPGPSVETDNAAVAASAMAPPPGPAASGPDLLIPAPDGMPLPQGEATRKALVDLLYESDKKAPPAEKKDEVCVPPAARPLRERRAAHKPPYRPEDDADEQPLEPCCAQSLLIVAPVAAVPGGAVSRRFAWSAHDIPLESGDRLHRVAVVASTYIEPLRPPKMERPSTLTAPRPKSKAECQRRCASDGFCDPSDLLGCGGVYCGKPRDILS